MTGILLLTSMLIPGNKAIAQQCGDDHKLRALSEVLAVPAGNSDEAGERDWPLTIGCNTKKERKLIQQIQQYRADHGLDPVPVSPALTKVADYHVADLNQEAYHKQRSGCNLHSWSGNGPWDACCYSNDGEHNECMWEKPQTLTNYRGNGFEIAHGTVGKAATVASALNGWQNSSGHNAVLINQGQWADLEWKAMGVSIHQNYAVVWFGRRPDPDEKPEACE